jgi:hypothetical protein
MIILKEQTTPHTINAILDGDAGDMIVLRDEETNISVTLFADFVTNSYYSTATILLPIVNEKTYTIEIYKTVALDFKTRVILDGGTFESYECLQNILTSLGSEPLKVYRDKIFCTNQTIAEYTINKDQYVQHTTINEYKIFE